MIYLCRRREARKIELYADESSRYGAGGFIDPSAHEDDRDETVENLQIPPNRNSQRHRKVCVLGAATASNIQQNTAGGTSCGPP